MGGLFERLAGTAVGTLAALIDLVLPTACAGCGGAWVGNAVCRDCAAVLAGPAVPARPTPAPPGLPPCLTGGEYVGVRRELILAYKERGRRDLARPLGAVLARVVRAGWPAGATGALALVPVPATAAAIRARHGDHMLTLARAASAQLRRYGLAAGVVPAVRALPRPDSAHLNREARAATAVAAFEVRPGWVSRLRPLADSGAVVVLDDILTTGSTLSAVTLRMLEAAVPVAFAATLAATRLRQAGQSLIPRAPEVPVPPGPMAPLG